MQKNSFKSSQLSAKVNCVRPPLVTNTILHALYHAVQCVSLASHASHLVREYNAVPCVYETMSRACYKCLCCNRTGVKWLAALSVIGLLAFVSTRFWSDPGRLVKVHRNYGTFPVQHSKFSPSYLAVMKRFSFSDR